MQVVGGHVEVPQVGGIVESLRRKVLNLVVANVEGFEVREGSQPAVVELGEGVVAEVQRGGGGRQCPGHTLQRLPAAA